MIERPAVERERGGGYRLRLGRPERAALRSLPGELLSLLGSDDPSLRRLFPPAYEDDPERQREYEALMRDDLLERKRSSLRTLEATAEADSLSPEELEAWLGALNDLRLVLGTRLAVTEEMDLEDTLEGTQARAYAVYHFLGWLQEQAVDALSRTA